MLLEPLADDTLIQLNERQAIPHAAASHKDVQFLVNVVREYHLLDDLWNGDELAELFIVEQQQCHLVGAVAQRIHEIYHIP